VLSVLNGAELINDKRKIWLHDETKEQNQKISRLLQRETVNFLKQKLQYGYRNEIPNK